MLPWIERAVATTANGDRLVLRERAGTVELRCNGWDLMSNRAHHSEQALARLACARVQAAAPHMLIGGLGFGYTLRAALDCLPPDARVTVAELLPEVIAWNRGLLKHLAGDPLSDPRVQTLCADVRTVLRATPAAGFDAVLLDTDNGPDAVMLADNAALYNPAGLRLIRAALAPAGVLGVWSADRSPRFATLLRDSGFRCQAHDIPARGAPDDPLHTIYLACA